MKRRDLIKGAIGGAALAVPMPASASGETEILRLFREREVLRDAMNNWEPPSGLSGRAGDEMMERLFFDDMDQIEGRVMALPCTCAADFAAKLLIRSCNGECLEWFDDGRLAEEALGLVSTRHVAV